MISFWHRRLTHDFFPPNIVYLFSVSKNILKYFKNQGVREVVELLSLLNSMPSLHLIHWYEGGPPSKIAMNCDIDPILLNQKFCLTNKTVVERVQLDTVEDFVFERCGEMSYRIFRMVKSENIFF